jgi:imidazolonepropionase-like amidohydrolase
MSRPGDRTLVIRNGTMIDGSGRAPTPNDALVVDPRGERARARGIRILCGTDTGNNTFMPFGELHTKELEILVTYCGFTALEAIVAATGGNAFAVGLEGAVGVLEAGKLADVIILKRDPLADIRVLQSGHELAWVIKDGKVVNLGDHAREPASIAFNLT